MIATNEYNSISSIQTFKSELSSVCFVRDYIELAFDGPIVRLNGMVSVDGNILLSSGKIKTESKTIMDLLRNIGRTVLSVEQESRTSLKLIFELGNEICVSSEFPGQEYAHFISSPKKKLTIYGVE